MRNLICQDCGKPFQAGKGNFKFCLECRGSETREGRRKRYLRNKKSILAGIRKYQLAHKEQLQAYMKSWYRANTEKMRIQSREYNRKFKVYLKTTGKAIRVNNKRQRPIGSQCELCRRIPNRLIYHHWTDEHPEWGMYICGYCHLFVERIEQGEQQSYWKLKTQIEEGKCEAQMRD